MFLKDNGHCTSNESNDGVFDGIFDGRNKKRYISLAMLLALLVCTGLESRNEIISDISLAMFLAHFLVFLKDSGYHLV